MTQSAVAGLAQGEVRTHEAGTLVITLAQHQVVGYRIEIRDGGDFVGARTYTYETDALREFDKLVDAYEAQGERTTVHLGGVTVTPSQQETVWRVETVQGGVRDEWSRSYATRDEALPHWLRVAAAFRRFGTAEAIETHRSEQGRQYWNQKDRERRRMHNPKLMESLRLQLEAIRDLGTPADVAELYAA